jgi:hypothetical protein
MKVYCEVCGQELRGKVAYGCHLACWKVRGKGGGV